MMNKVDIENLTVEQYLMLKHEKQTKRMVGTESVIDTLEGPKKTMLLGRQFLATIHAQIDVFKGGISLGVGNEKVKFDMNEEICHSRVPLEKVYMTKSIQENEYFNPYEVENDDSFALEQRTLNYSEESIDIIDSCNDI
nr:hypothetical protein [Tanacetum cinerariifolium]